MLVEACPKIDSITGEIKEFVRNHEAGFLTALQDYGDQIGRGREKCGTHKGWSTGLNQCDIGTEIYGLALKQRFPMTQALLSVSLVVIINDFDYYQDEDNLPTKLHGRLNLSTPSGINLFLDPTYGQVNRRLNRVVLDHTSRESIYYGRISRTPHLFLIEPSQNLEEAEYYHPNEIAAIKESLK